jgi:hypothetical protein
MIDRQPVDIKNVHKIRRRPAIETEENTLSTLSDSMMLTIFIASPEQMLCLRTEIVNKAHRSSRLVRECCSEPWLAYVYVNEDQNHNMLTFPLCCFDHISCWFPKRTA